MSTSFSANEMRTEAEHQGQSLGARLTKKLSKKLSISGGSKEGANERGTATASSSKATAGESGIGQQALNQGQEIKDQPMKGDAKDIAAKGENTNSTIGQGDVKGTVAGIGLTGDNVNKKNAEETSQRLGGYRSSISAGPLEYNDDIKKGPITTGVQRDTGQAGYGGISGSSQAGGLDASKKEWGQTQSGDPQIRQAISPSQHEPAQAYPAVGTAQSQPGLNKNPASLSQGEKGLSPSQQGPSQSQKGMKQGLSSIGNGAGAKFGGEEMLQQELHDQLAIDDDVFGSAGAGQAASKSATKPASKRTKKARFGGFGGGTIGNILRRASGQGKSARSNAAKKKPAKATPQASNASKSIEQDGIDRGTMAGIGAGSGVAAAMGGLEMNRAMEKSPKDKTGMEKAGMANTGIGQSGTGHPEMKQSGMTNAGMTNTGIGQAGMANVAKDYPSQATTQTSNTSKTIDQHTINRKALGGVGAGAGTGAVLGGLGMTRVMDKADASKTDMGQSGMNTSGMDKSAMSQSGMSKNGMPATAMGPSGQASTNMSLYGGTVRGGSAVMSGSSESPKTTTSSSGKAGAVAATGVAGAGAGAAGMAGMTGKSGMSNMSGKPGMTGTRGTGLTDDINSQGLNNDSSDRGYSGATGSTTTNTSGVSTQAVRGLSTSTHKLTVLQDKVQAVSQKCKTQLGVSSTEISERSPTVDIFFDAVAAERLRWMPRDGSRLDCSLRWASRLAYAVDALRESTRLFAPGADTAAQLIWGFMILLLECDMDNTDLFESVFGRYGRVAVGIYLLLQYESAYKTSTNLQSEAAAVFSDLLEMVCNTTTSCIEGFKAKELTQLIERNVDAAFVTYAKRYSTHWNAIVESSTSELVKQSSMIYSSPELGSLRQFLGVQDRPLQFILESRMHSLADGSFEWFNSTLYEFSVGKTPVMLVTGGAGSGKSALAQWTVERLQESAEHDSWHVIPYTIRES